MAANYQLTYQIKVLINLSISNFSFQDFLTLIVVQIEGLGRPSGSFRRRQQMKTAKATIKINTRDPTLREQSKKIIPSVGACLLSK